MFEFKINCVDYGTRFEMCIRTPRGGFGVHLKRACKRPSFKEIVIMKKKLIRLWAKAAK